MRTIIILALMVLPPAAFICFLTNLFQYISARKKKENAKKRTWIIPLVIFIVSSLCMIIEMGYFFIEFGNAKAH